MKKKSEQQDNIAVENTTQIPHTELKKKFNSADMVLAGGLVLIVGGMFWLMSGGLDSSENSNTKVSNATKTTKGTAKKVETQTPFYEQAKTQSPQDVIHVGNAKDTGEEAPPFIYHNQADFSNENLMPPPEAYEQNISKLAKESAPLPREELATKKEDKTTQEPNLPKVKPAEVQAQNMPKAQNSEVAVASSIAPEAVVYKKPQQSTILSQDSYVCSIIAAYGDMLGKEIMYYVKDKATHKYLPAYSQKNWDESGVWVKKKLIATQLDVHERMVEVAKGKWIPALEFMTCTLIQEDMR